MSAAIVTGRDYTPPVVRMVEDDHSRYPDPALDQSWSPLEKLRWHAAVVELETGLRVRVGDANYSIGGKPQRHYFSVSVSHKRGGGSSGPYSFSGAWDYLNGISTGAEAARFNMTPYSSPAPSPDPAAGEAAHAHRIQRCSPAGRVGQPGEGA